MDKKRIIIGCGTGRCGTVSFSILLQYQGIESTHEYMRMPWIYDKRRFNYVLHHITSRIQNIVADTAFYYLPYVETLISRYKPFIKIVCLKRDMNDTVNSYMNKTTGRNHWCDDGKSKKDSRWDDCYPFYSDITNKRLAIERYYTEYYNVASLYQNKYPDVFRIYDYNHILNTESGQIELFNFLCIDDYKVELDIKENQTIV
jgi:hypothetical protein